MNFLWGKKFHPGQIPEQYVAAQSIECAAIGAAETSKMFVGTGTKVGVQTLTRINPHREAKPMKKLIILTAGALLASGGAFAQQMSAGRAELMTSVPQSSLTVTDWYKQNVYDPNNSKIGEILDVLVAPGGQVNAVIVGVGGFLGAGEKDVAVNFHSIKASMKDNKMYLTMDTTKDALKNAPGFKYDSTKTSWVPSK